MRNMMVILAPWTHRGQERITNVISGSSWKFLKKSSETHYSGVFRIAEHEFCQHTGARKGPGTSCPGVPGNFWNNRPDLITWRFSSHRTRIWSANWPPVHLEVGTAPRTLSPEDPWNFFKNYLDFKNKHF